MFDKESPLFYVGIVLLILVFISPFFLMNRVDHFEDLSHFQSESFELPFSILEPNKMYAMPRKLKEISGLTLKNNQQVYTVNDEKGKLYLFDFDQGVVISEIDFGKQSDYEALATKGDTVYVAESNGNIIVVSTVNNTKVDEIDTPLNSSNDVEGLCFDSARNQLLIACKGQLESGKHRKGRRGIYSFDLSTQSFQKDPYLLIDLKEELKKLNPVDVEKSISQKSKIKSRVNMFAPSGLAIDPITGYLYVLANKGGILTVFDKGKNILGVFFLNQKIYSQPEGIVFNKAGDLYISNEGKSKKANIYCLSRKSF